MIFLGSALPALPQCLLVMLCYVMLWYVMFGLEKNYKIVNTTSSCARWHQVLQYKCTEEFICVPLQVVQENCAGCPLKILTIVIPLSNRGAMAMSIALTLAKCSPFPNNGFPGWMALGGVPMTGAAKSGSTGLDQSSRTGYWRVYGSETNIQVTHKQETFSYLTTWCECILLTFSGNCASHYKRQRQLYKYDHVLQLGWAKCVLAELYVFMTTGRRKVCTHRLLPPCGDFWRHTLFSQKGN